MSVGVFMSGWTPPGTSFAVVGIGSGGIDREVWRLERDGTL